MKKIYLFILLFFIQNQCLQAQADIAEARTFSQGSTVTITGIVTSGDEFGPIRYMQDATGGLPFYQPSISDQIQPGDEVTITGEMGDFMGLIQVVNISNWNKISSGNPEPTPQLVTPNGINGDTEAELVTLENITFVDGGGSAQFTGNTSFGIISGVESSVVYVRSSNPLVGFTIPETPVTLTGIVSAFNGSYQLLLRGESDIDGRFVDNVEQDNITTTSFDLSWVSNFQGTTNLRYGTDPANLVTEVNMGGASTDHAISLSGLSPATFYYVQVYTDSANVIAQSPVKVFSTASNSSGEVRVYFNNAVDVSFSTGVDAIYHTPAQIEADIISYIDNAQSTIDMCIYNINRIPIVEALNNAVNRGVVVRCIANSGTLNSALSDGDPIFNWIDLNGSALMHNKFMIVDAASTNNSWVMSGSMNLTQQNLLDDFNNILFVQDEALAKCYTLEFNEMWGDTGDSPFIFTLKVGDQKADNTPHKFLIGGEIVESYFSPSDNTTNAITTTLKTAETDIQFATLTFTMNDMRDALFDRFNDGVNVRGIIENINDTGGDYQAMVDGGINVKDHPASGSIHHKYAIVDATNTTSDPLVITGSHNWSASAESSNDENTLILHSAIIANVYLQEFEARWAGIVAGVDGVETIPGFEATILPNPVKDIATIAMHFENTADVAVSLWSLDGKLLQSRILRNQNGKQFLPLEVSQYPAGNYIVSFQMGQQITAKKMIIVK